MSVCPTVLVASTCGREALEMNCIEALQPTKRSRNVQHLPVTRKKMDHHRSNLTHTIAAHWQELPLAPPVYQDCPFLVNITLVSGKHGDVASFAQSDCCTPIL
eukprot:2101474-Amphidinium_carterae.1